MIDFKETAYEIFKICTDIRISDGRASEKIADILESIYEEGLTDKQTIKEDTINDFKRRILTETNGCMMINLSHLIDSINSISEIMLKKSK